MHIADANAVALPLNADDVIEAMVALGVGTRFGRTINLLLLRRSWNNRVHVNIKMNIGPYDCVMRGRQKANHFALHFSHVDCTPSERSGFTDQSLFFLSSHPHEG